MRGRRSRAKPSRCRTGTKRKPSENQAGTERKPRENQAGTERKPRENRGKKPLKTSRSDGTPCLTGAKTASASRQHPAGQVRYHRDMGRSITSTIAAYRDATLEVFAETLWPTRCAVCDAQGKHLCDTCAQALPYIDLCRACPRCGAPHGLVQCTECNPVTLAASGRERIPLDGMVSAVSLGSDSRRIVTTYKDRGERALCETMAEVMARYIHPDWGRDATITFVPATTEARRRRGFDHAELLAQATARRLGIEAIELFARPRSRDQRELGRRGRIENMRSRIHLIPGAASPARVIVVDDVCTTGATLFAAADALQASGARAVFGATFARA